MKLSAWLHVYAVVTVLVGMQCREPKHTTRDLILTQVWFRDGFPVEVRAPGNRTADDVSAVYAVLGTGSNQWDLELKVFNHSATGMYSCHRGNEQVSLVVESGELLVNVSCVCL